jgi:hypothetical protein
MSKNYQKLSTDMKFQHKAIAPQHEYFIKPKESRQ